MDWQNPLRAIARTVDVDVLQVLARTHTGVTGHQLAQLAGRSYAQVSAVVDRLTDQGIVHVEQVGRTYSYRLNRQHVVASAVIAALDATHTVEEEIGRTVAEWELPPRSVAIFGSAARRDAAADSDVDLLIIREESTSEDDLGWAYQTAELADRIEALTGNRAQLVDLTVVEVLQARRSGQPLIESLILDARTLAGEDVHELLLREANDDEE